MALNTISKLITLKYISSLDYVPELQTPLSILLPQHIFQMSSRYLKLNVFFKKASLDSFSPNTCFSQIFLFQYRQLYPALPPHPPNTQINLSVILKSSHFLTLYHIFIRKSWLILLSSHVHSLITFYHFCFYQATTVLTYLTIIAF